MQSGTKTVARVYCRNTRLRNGGARLGKLRFEREQRFTWACRRKVEELQDDRTAATYWGARSEWGKASGVVTRVPRETQTMKLIERVQLGEISTPQYEQLSGFLDAERLGITNRVYNNETARRRRALAKKLGISVTDAQAEPLDVALDELLVVARSGWPD